MVPTLEIRSDAHACEMRLLDAGADVGRQLSTTPIGAAGVARLAGELLQSLEHACRRARPSVTAAHEVVSQAEQIASALLPPELRKALASLPPGPLRLDVSGPASAILWEVVPAGALPLGLQFAVGRCARAQEPGTPCNKSPRSVLVANPTFDLPATLAEVDAILRLLNASGIVPRSLCHRVDRRTLNDLMADCDWLHFAGHAGDAAAETPESMPGDWRLADGRFGPGELAGHDSSRLPRFVFANGCATISIHAIGGADQACNLAGSLRQLGVAHVLGTVVTLCDRVCTSFAEFFYRQALSGGTIGEAVRQARLATRGAGPSGDCSWSAYVLLGDPCVSLVENVPASGAARQPGSIVPEATGFESQMCQQCGRQIRTRHGLVAWKAGTPHEVALCRACARVRRNARSGQLDIADGIDPPGKRSQAGDWLIFPAIDAECDEL